MSSGWIKLSYRLLDWKWYGDPNMVALFVHLLLRANFKPMHRKGEMFGRGVVVTSREELSRETGISPRSIRTCLSRLETTNEITIKATKQGSVITISNYDKYQCPDKESDQQKKSKATNDRPTTDQATFEKHRKIDQETDQETDQATNNINVSESAEYQDKGAKSDQANDQASDQRPTNDRPTIFEKTTNSEEYNNIYLVVDDITREAFFEDFFSESRKSVVDELCMARSFVSVENFKRLASAVLAEWAALPEPKHRTMKEARQHLINHCSRKMSAEISELKKTTQNHESATTPRQNFDTANERKQEFIEHVTERLTTPGSPKRDLTGYY